MPPVCSPADAYAAVKPGLAARLLRDPVRRVFVLSTGDGAPINGLAAIPPDWLPAHRIRYAGHCAWPAEGGCVHARWQSGAGNLPLWRDHLPELRIRVVHRDGYYTSFYLVRDEKVSPVPGVAVRIEVPGDFELGAGKSEFHFPLIQGDERDETRYEVFLRAPAAFPLREKLSLKLRLTYTYGADEPYELIFVPPAEAPAGVKPVRAEWRPQPPPTVELPHPDFPPIDAWSYFTRYPTLDGAGTQNLLARIVQDTDRLAARIWNPATGELNLPWLTDDQIDHLLRNMERRQSFCFRTVWTGGHTLRDNDVDPDFHQAMGGVQATLLQLMRLPGTPGLPEKLKPVCCQFASNALFLLSCLHGDAPEPVFSRLHGLIQDRPVSEGTLRRYRSHIGLALGNAALPGQRELLRFVFELIESGDDSLVANGFGILGVAFWRHPGFWSAVAPAIRWDHLQILLAALPRDQRVRAGQPDGVPEVLPGIVAKLECLLALLRLRTSNAPGQRRWLAAGQPLTLKFEKLIFDLCDEVGRSRAALRSRLRLNLAKPAELARTPDLLYALTLYLTGESGAESIQVTGVTEE